MPLPDGLADLDDKRSRKVRAVPPPRHAKRESQQAVVLSPATETSGIAAPVDGQEEAPSSVTEPQRRAPRRSPKVDQRPTGLEHEPIRLVQVYLPQSADDYLRQVRAESLTRRKDVTASAAVRYAMEALMQTKTPAELVELLGTRAGTGRKGRSRK